MREWVTERRAETRKKPRETMRKTEQKERGQKILKQIGHCEEVRRPVPYCDHPIFWEPRVQSRCRRRCCQADKLMRWTQRGWTGWIPAYLSVTSLALSRVLLLGEWTENGNREQLQVFNFRRHGAIWTLRTFSFQRIFDAAYIYFCTKVKEPVSVYGLTFIAVI